MAENNKEFSERLVQALRRAAKTQGQLAQEADVRPETISKYVRHGNVPEWHILVKIARSLKVSTDWLLTGQEDATGPAEPAPRVARPPAAQEHQLAGQPGGALTAAKARLLALDGLPMEEARLAELGQADALGMMLTAWLRLQVIKRPGCLPRVEAALAQAQRACETESVGASAALPAEGEPAARDYIDLPYWDPRALADGERTLLKYTLEILRSPGLPGKWDDSLTRNIKTFHHGAVNEAKRPRAPAWGQAGSQKQASGGGQQDGGGGATGA